MAAATEIKVTNAREHVTLIVSLKIAFNRHPEFIPTFKALKEPACLGLPKRIMFFGRRANSWGMAYSGTHAASSTMTVSVTRLNCIGSRAQVKAGNRPVKSASVAGSILLRHWRLKNVFSNITA